MTFQQLMLKNKFTVLISYLIFNIRLYLFAKIFGQYFSFGYIYTLICEYMEEYIWTFIRENVYNWIYSDIHSWVIGSNEYIWIFIHQRKITFATHWFQLQGNLKLQDKLWLVPVSVFKTPRCLDLHLHNLQPSCFLPSCSYHAI